MTDQLEEGPVPEARGSKRSRGQPPFPMRLLGRGQSALIARAPSLWPLVRRPTRWYWEKAAKHWDERRDPDSAEHLAPLAAACARLEAEPRAILEIRTGTGAGALMLARRFSQARVWASDISEGMIRAARAKTPPEIAARLHYEVADAASLPNDAESFDLVAQLNLPLFAEEAIRVLRPGGHLVVASSLGPATPYYTPEAVLRRLFEREGLEEMVAGESGEGNYFLARRPPGRAPTRP